MLPGPRRPARGLVLTAAALLAALLPGTAVATGTAASDGSAPPEVFATYSSGTGSRVDDLRTLAEIMAVPSGSTGYAPPDRAPLDRLRAACPPVRCQDHRLRVPPGVQVSDSSVRVLLPVGYRTSRKRYPVVVLFNGALSAYDAWSRKTQLTAITREHEAIFVMPEGGYGAEPGMFADWVDGSYDWETFHTEVVVPWVDRRFRTVPGARAAVGASMGSLGALGYAARHPGLFDAVLTLSGVVDTDSLVANTLPAELAEALGVRPPDLRRVWGDPVLRRANWRRHDPTALASRLRDVELFVASGTGFPSALGNQTHSGDTEMLLWQGHRTFLTALTAAGVPFEARVAQGGVHNWPWFDTALRWGLPQAVAATRR
ncbi:alpha/beta hydrolase [Nocardioides perillae]|uniref:S-formylglutathione hydrolase FrmB n=1 Tax=Nocardioides perillae TaxID=1119534 RepID=A0A7Y9RSW1_9ACTN|nr:alpha/beta hydrolase family protein [Nocardioides perillae]NYG55986.1 S-formylglutathione hydrolase FrmB [Nocardioides perillae]